VKIFKDDFNISLQQMMNSKKEESPQENEDNLLQTVEEICKSTHHFDDVQSKIDYYSSMYPNLFTAYPTALKKACESNFDLEKFKWMMNMQNSVLNNQISQHNASIEVGERLVDEHVKPRLS
jgi:hypothetical protein